MIRSKEDSRRNYNYEDFKRALLEEIILYTPIYSSYECTIEQIYRLMLNPRLEKVNRIIDNEINKIL